MPPGWSVVGPKLGWTLVGDLPCRGWPLHSAPGAADSLLNSAPRGVSSSPRRSRDLARAVACLGSKGMTPTLGWSCSTQRGEVMSSAQHPMLPSWHPWGSSPGGCPMLLGPPQTTVPATGTGTLVHSRCQGSTHPCRTLISAGMERPAQGPTPACRVEQDHAWSQALWPQQGWRGALDVHRHPGEMATVPSAPSVPGWPAQGPDAVTAEGSSQSRRNVLLHGREEITAKECAVPRPGPGGAREEPEGKKNKLQLSQGYRAPVLLVAIFFLLPLK